MNVTILCVGKIKEKYLTQGIEEYLKRLKSYAKVTIVEVKEETTDKNISISIEKESKEIIKNMEKINGYNILLYIQGNMYTSEGLAQKISDLTVKGISSIVFIIGGSYGVSKDVVSKADELLSFSKMTFPHQLMRLILSEQIYRCFSILNNSKYHK